MPHNRFFYPGPLQKGRLVPIKDTEKKHMQVMRIAIGDQCEIINGKGDLATATITSIDKKCIELSIDSLTSEPEKTISFSLALGLQKMLNLSFCIEKCTELGVKDFFIFTGDLSEKKDLSSQAIQRLQNIILSAVKQSGRLFLPDVSFFSSIYDIPYKEKELLYGDFQPTASSFKIEKEKNLLFFIGPEKGFSTNETTFLQKQINAKGVKISSYILRAETAAITAAALSAYLLTSSSL